MGPRSADVVRARGSTAMHNRFDKFVKDVLREGFGAMGTSQPEVEVSSDAQRIDFLFTPRPKEAAEPTTSDLPPTTPPIFVRMASTPCVVEHYRKPPDIDAIRDCLRKQLTWHHTRLNEAARKRDRESGEARPPMPPVEAPEIGVLWALSTGRPAGVLSGFAFRPLRGWPAGVYGGPLPAVPFRMIVLNELPRDRTTLPLRLLGRGKTLRRALRELRALPPDAWERQHILPLLVTLRIESQDAQSNPVTEEEKELLVNVQEYLQNLEDTARQQGIQQGLQRIRELEEAARQQGLRQGLQQVRELEEKARQQGIQPLLHLWTRKLGRPLTDHERALIRARLDSLGPDRLGDVILDLSAEALAAWLADPAAQ